MIVVSNSGPLMALAKLGLLDLLARLFGQVRIPSGVFAEVVVRGGEWGSPDAVVVQMAVQRAQLVVAEIRDADLPPGIASAPLDMGEKQVLHLALHDEADLVLLDDLKAREEAQARGMAVRGTLGVVVQAHRSGLLQLGEVEAIVEAMIARDDIWIAEGLCRQVLARLKGSVSSQWP